jgi:hypothetical protein
VASRAAAAVALPAFLVLHLKYEARRGRPRVFRMKNPSWLVMLATSLAFTETLTFDNAVIGKTPSGWRASPPPSGTSPAWKVLKESSAPSQPYVLAHVPDGAAAEGFPMVLLEQPPSANGEISVKFRTGGGNGHRDAGLVWRYRDPNNYYVVRADARQKNVAVFRVVDGKPQPLTPRGRPQSSWAIPQNINPDGWGILKVVFKGPAFSVYYHHRRILRVDDSAYLGPGKVGLWTRRGSVAYFDNFRFVPKR